MNTQDSISPNPPKPEDIVMQTTCEHRSSSAQSGVAAIASVALAAVLASCKKDPEVMYEINPVELYSNAAEKDKLKSSEQFISILFTNLFQQALSSNQIFEITQCLESIGDKELAREVLISNFFNASGVIMPTEEQMDANMDGFLDDTYTRFFVRLPSEAERTWMRNFIQNNPFMTPELVYFSFALSNEYLYY